MNLYLHALLPRSRANGPGVRTVVWFHGCTLGCPGCFNPHTHSGVPPIVMSVEALVAPLIENGRQVEGISISGGEPLQQPTGLLDLLRSVRSATALSVLVFSGYTLAEIQRMPLGGEILALVDVLIDGRYVHSQRLARGLRGSANQKTHLLTERYGLDDLESPVPCEIRITQKGDLVITGIRPVDIRYPTGCPESTCVRAARR